MDRRPRPDGSQPPRAAERSPQPEGPPVERRARRLGREKTREEEEEPPPSAEPNAPGEEPDDRARLAAVNGEEQERGHPDGEIGRIDRSRPHLAALVAHPERPVATARPGQVELRREREAARLVRPEVLRHPA